MGREVRAAALFGSKSTDVQCARCSSGRKEREAERVQRAAEESLASLRPLLTFFFARKGVHSALMEETHSEPLNVFQSKIVNNHLKSTVSTLGDWMHSPATLLDAAFSRL